VACAIVRAIFVPQPQAAVAALQISSRPPGHFDEALQFGL
jgi:hypothetical protein